MQGSKQEYVRCFTFGEGGIYRTASEAAFAAREYYRESLKSDDSADWEKAQEARERHSWWYDRSRKMDRMLEDRGVRYRDCDFDNYEICAKLNDERELQTQAIESLRKYAAEPKESIGKGRNVVVIGPKGTGKDHLTMALAKAVMTRSGVPTHWLNGCDLQNQFRVAATGGKAVEVLEEPPDILWISDPIPPTGSLNEFQQASLFALIDKRYSNLKPTWITLNIANRAEGEMRMGAQTFDRLCHDALIVQTNWESYRKK